MTKTHEIRVIAYSGRRAEERPAAVILDGERLDVQHIEDSWISSGVDSTAEVFYVFIVRCRGGARFRLAHGDESGWRAELLPGPRIVPV